MQYNARLTDTIINNDDCRVYISVQAKNQHYAHQIASALESAAAGVVAEEVHGT